MVVGERLLKLRQWKKMSQGEMEKRTGLLRCYISRVENGHTVPSLETLEKMAGALEVPLYRIFYDGKAPLTAGNLPWYRPAEGPSWGYDGDEAKFFLELRRALEQMGDGERKLLLAFAHKLATTRATRKSAAA